MGRIDDVLKVAGHRLGTMEIESALVAHPRVAEAAVVGRPHEIKGESVFAFVVLRGSRSTGDSDTLHKELRDFVAKELGPIAKPDDIRIADNLPKTRSGKIMRRLLKAIARGDEITQDVSTLENPAILDQLRGVDTASAGARAPAASAARAAPRRAGKSAGSARRRAPAKRKRAKSKATTARTAKSRRSAVARKARVQTTRRKAKAAARAVVLTAAAKRARSRAAGRRRR